MKAGILIGHLSNKGNEGAIIRTAEAFGINNIFVLGKREKDYYAAEGCDKHLNFFEFKSIGDFLNYCIKNNHKVVCLENINIAKDITKIDKYPVNPIFVTGNEKNGVPEELLKASSLIIKIPQGFGYATCLNTGTACGIVIYDFFNKHLKKREELWMEK